MTSGLLDTGSDTLNCGSAGSARLMLCKRIQYWYCPNMSVIIIFDIAIDSNAKCCVYLVSVEAKFNFTVTNPESIDLHATFKLFKAKLDLIQHVLNEIGMVDYFTAL